jgi:SAM-dependent methyltransferase
MPYRPAMPSLASAAAWTARAYNAAGPNYLAYADGDAAQPYNFTSSYNFADREIWRRLDAALWRLAAQRGDRPGPRRLRLLDAGCGPGTWLRRVALRARDVGFDRVEAAGVDISPAMLALARSSIAQIDDSGIKIDLVEADLSETLPFGDDAFDITLCLYGVFNHLAVPAHHAVAAELGRVTADSLYATVRAAGSLPTIYVDTLENARAFHQDNEAGWMDVDLTDGRHLHMPSHLFTASELRALFQPHLGGVAMLGLDVFHSRFALNTHWNPANTAADDAFMAELEALEQCYARDPKFIDRAAHILLIGEK